MTQPLPNASSFRAEPLARIREALEALSVAQQQVGRVFLDAPDWSIRVSVEEIARRANVSGPTVVRFCRALGFEGLSDFKLRLAQSLAGGTPFLHRMVNSNDDAATIVHKIFLGSAEVLTNLSRQLDPSIIEAAISALASAKRIECYSVGATSTFLANDAQARFSRLGLGSNAYFDAHMQLISAAALSSSDVVLAISHIGRMPTLLEAVEVARERGATIIGITKPDTPLAALCSLPISVEVPEDAAVRVGTEAYLAGQVLLEVLMVGVGLRLGPAAIARLQRVHDVLQDRGVDSEVHPALTRGWSKPARDVANDQ